MNINDIENLLKTSHTKEDTFSDKAIKKSSELIRLIENYKRTRGISIDESRRQINIIKQESNKINNLIKNECNNLNKFEPYTSMESDWECIVCKENNTYRVIFNKLLPSREYYTYSDRDDLRAMQNKLKEELLKVPLVKYTDRVLIKVIHHFNDKMKDYDNLGFKAAVDILSLYLLEDDNPKHMALLQDYVDDERNFTEIVVTPYSDMRP